MLYYSVDFGEEGRLKDGQGLRHVLAHNLRTEPDAQMKENVDTSRVHWDRVWLNSACGHGAQDQSVPSLDAWVAPAELPQSIWDDASAGVMDALHEGLGITRARFRDGAPLLFGEGYGGKPKKMKRPKVRAGASDEERQRAEEEAMEASRRALRSDAVLVQNFIVQASPAFFFPAIEGWEQTEIDDSEFLERLEASPEFLAWRTEHFPDGAVDWASVEWGEVPGIAWDRVEQFQRVATEWALKRFGADRVQSVALHMDEKSPHVHIQIVPFAQGKDGVATLSAKQLIGAGADACRQMLDDMQQYFAPLGLHRPIEGNPSTGETYRDKFRAALRRAEEAEQRAEQAEERAQRAEKRLSQANAERQALQHDLAGLRATVAMQAASMAEAQRVARQAKAKSVADAKRAEEEVARMLAEAEADRRVAAEARAKADRLAQEMGATDAEEVQDGLALRRALGRLGEWLLLHGRALRRAICDRIWRDNQDVLCEIRDAVRAEASVDADVNASGPQQD